MGKSIASSSMSTELAKAAKLVRALEDSDVDASMMQRVIDDVPMREKLTDFWRELCSDDYLNTTVSEHLKPEVINAFVYYLRDSTSIGKDNRAVRIMRESIAQGHLQEALENAINSRLYLAMIIMFHGLGGYDLKSSEEVAHHFQVSVRLVDRIIERHSSHIASELIDFIVVPHSKQPSADERIAITGDYSGISIEELELSKELLDMLRSMEINTLEQLLEKLTVNLLEAHVNKGLRVLDELGPALKRRGIELMPPPN